ncbi:phage tail sheath subtilisin-like domain-containing protein [Alkaliphilus crotonatoxidans]
MSIKNTQRIGVFSESIVSKEVSGFPGTCLPVGIVATVDESVYTGEAKAHGIQLKEEAQELFGKDSEMAKLIEIVTLSGVNRIIAVPVLGSEEGISKADYEAALNLLANEEAVKIVISDTTDPEIHQAIKLHCEAASENRKERRCHLGLNKELSVSAMTNQAAALNSGRVTLWGSVPLRLDGTAHDSSVYLAAAAAAQDALELDPAMPIHNVQLPASLFGGLYNRLEEAQYEALYGGGVAACRAVNGRIYIDRWVTTYTQNDQVNPPVADDIYQEGTVAKVKDYIDEGLRNRLATLHPRVKASQSVMNEIKADTMAWLKEQEALAIIEEPVITKIEQQADLRSRFHVYYSYKVVLPLNTIFLHGKALV